MVVIRDERSDRDPRFSKNVVESFSRTGLDKTLPLLNLVYALDPDWTELYTQFIRGDLYAREVLSQATREICACAALATLDKQIQLKGHLCNGVALGASKEELLEALFQSVTYAGFPATLTSLMSYAEVFPEMLEREHPLQPATPGGIPSDPIFEPAVENLTGMLGEQRAREMIDRKNRWDADYGQSIQRFVYGGLYARRVVDPKLRQLIAVACLTVTDMQAELVSHIRAGLRVGLKPEEIREVIFQMTAYVGVPRVNHAMATFEQVVASGTPT